MTDTKQEELLPCLFCGGPAKLRRTSADCVYCLECEAAMRMNTQVLAIKAGNSRPDQRIAKLKAENAELNDRVKANQQALAAYVRDCAAAQSQAAAMAGLLERVGGFFAAYDKTLVAADLRRDIAAVLATWKGSGLNKV